MVTISPRIITLMLNSQFRDMTDDILQVRIAVAAILPAQVIQPSDAIEQEVDNGNDDSDADGIAPDDDDSDDASVSIRGKVGRVAGIANLGWGRNPTEDAEQRCKDVDTEDGGNKLPGGQGFATPGNED